jgi:hypothetical protein
MWSIAKGLTVNLHAVGHLPPEAKSAVVRGKGFG